MLYKWDDKIKISKIIKKERKMGIMNLKGLTCNWEEENKTKLKICLCTCTCKIRYGKTENSTDSLIEGGKAVTIDAKPWPQNKNKKWNFTKTDDDKMNWLDRNFVCYALVPFISSADDYFSATRCEYLWYVCYHARSSRQRATVV